MPDAPPLALTPVDLAVPDYTTASDEHKSNTVSLPLHGGEAGEQRGFAICSAAVPGVKTQLINPSGDDSKMPPPAVPAFGGCTGVAFPASAPAPPPQPAAGPGAGSVIASSSSSRSVQIAQAAGTARPPPPSRQTFGNQTSANAVGKMNAGRAALIAMTPATDLQQTSTAKLIDGRGPRSSGENNTPLGRRKPSVSAVTTELGGGAQLVNGASSRTWLNPTSNASTGPAHGRAQTMSSVHNGAAENVYTAVSSAHRATANMQKTLDDARKAAFLGSKSFGSQNHASQGLVAASNGSAPANTGSGVSAPGAVSSSFTFTMPASGQAKPAATTANPAPPKELQTWRTVEGQIKAAVESTKRQKKCCNTPGQRQDTQALVKKALAILRHLILGGNHAEMTTALAKEPSAQQTAATPTPSPMVGVPVQAQVQGPQGPPPPPPSGMMVWDWASGSWQWKWQ